MVINANKFYVQKVNLETNVISGALTLSCVDGAQDSVTKYTHCIKLHMSRHAEQVRNTSSQEWHLIYVVIHYFFKDAELVTSLCKTLNFR